jgi:hypothetical protein
MYQTAREAAESDDARSSAYQDAFEKALSVSLKGFLLRSDLSSASEWVPSTIKIVERIETVASLWDQAR